LWIVTFHLDRFKNLINNDKDEFYMSC
jgi:hypothetical protein